MTTLSAELRDLLDKIFVADEFKRITIKVWVGLNVWCVCVVGHRVLLRVCVGEWVLLWEAGVWEVVVCGGGGGVGRGVVWVHVCV